MSKTKRSKLWIPFFVIILAGLIFLGFRIIGIARPDLIPGGDKNTVENTEEPAESIFAVNTIQISTRELNEYLDLNGDVISTNQVDVYPETSGKIVRLPVKVGRHVNKEDIVAWVDPSRPGMNYAESPVKSPISGTVTVIYASIGGMAAPQGPIIAVGDLSSLQVTVYIPEIYTSRIYQGMPAELSFETFQEEIFSAEVVEISPVIDPVSRTMEIKLKITGDRGKIKPGMFAKVNLILEKKKEALAVPANCIIYRNKDAFVFTVEGNSARMVPVSPGISENGFTEIRGDINHGQEVVYQGMNLLEDGARIRIINRQDQQ